MTYSTATHCVQDGLQETDALYSVKQEEEEMKKMSRGGGEETLKLNKKNEKNRGMYSRSPFSLD